MKKKTIWAHTLVKNEERYLWYAVMAIIDHVDKVLLWDTGSSDHTVEIIQEIKKIKGEKVDFREVGSVDPVKFTEVRQKMLDETKSDWFLIVDGDEIWWEDSIKKVVETIKNDESGLEMIISPYYNIIGDIYHYQEEAGGGYYIDNHSGHINIRAVSRNIPGLHLEKPHGQQGFYDGERVLIQERPVKNRQFLDFPYLHFTNMRRSFSAKEDKNVPKRNIKFKYELGISFSKDFSYPEVFYKDAPEFVLSPWSRMSNSYLVRAGMETLLKKVKRAILLNKKVGY